MSYPHSNILGGIFLRFIQNKAHTGAGITLIRRNYLVMYDIKHLRFLVYFINPFNLCRFCPNYLRRGYKKACLIL